MRPPRLSHKYEVLQKCRRVKTGHRNRVADLASFDQEKAQSPAIRITEEPTLVTKGKINRPGYKYFKYFRLKLNRQSNLVLILVLVLVPESKGP